MGRGVQHSGDKVTYDLMNFAVPKWGAIENAEKWGVKVINAESRKKVERRLPEA